MTDPRTRAYRICGKVRKSLPEMHVSTLQVAITREINEALEEQGIPTVLHDPYRADFVKALDECSMIALDPKIEMDEALMRSRSILLRFFRGIGK